MRAFVYPFVTSFHLHRDQNSLVWSKVPLTQLSENFPHLAKQIMVDVRRRSSSRKFPHAALVWAIVASSQPPPGEILSPRWSDSATSNCMPSKVTCFSGLPSTGLQNPIHFVHLCLGSAVNLLLKPLRFLCIQDWHPSQKIELLPTRDWITTNRHHKGVFPCLWVSAGFCRRS